jgi:hypothetical protein
LEAKALHSAANSSAATGMEIVKRMAIDCINNETNCSAGAEHSCAVFQSVPRYVLQ